MKFEIKDPGSAITHFIGMLMAAFAATPLLIRAARQPDMIVASGCIYRKHDSALCSQHHLPHPESL